MATQASVMTIRTDEDVQSEVIDELKWDAQVRVTDIGVSVKNGIVTLSGQVDTYAKKWAAQDAAHRVRGVKAVANDIEVHVPTSAERTDTDLASSVFTTLTWDAMIPTDKLDITVTKGWVTLKGEVQYGFQRLAAERAVNRLAGIRGVTNEIEVKAHLVPATIKHDIERALVRNAQTDAHLIKVEAQGSTIILRGAVRSFAEKQAAEQTAWSAPGVTSVDNRITIQ